jgi:hypothetical protein
MQRAWRQSPFALSARGDDRRAQRASLVNRIVKTRARGDAQLRAARTRNLVRMSHDRQSRFHNPRCAKRVIPRAMRSAPAIASVIPPNKIPGGSGIATPPLGEKSIAITYCDDLFSKSELLDGPNA